LIVLAPLSAAGQQKTAPARKPGIYAAFDTSMGSFVCELYEKQAPVAVANFVGLAEGTKEWLNTKGDFQKKPFYNGLTFHRVLKNYLIQAGDITGTGGNFQAVIPFENEIVTALKFDHPGVLAMANNGPPKTNTTQFFITVVPAPALDAKYTIFGRVVDGLTAVQAISNVPAFASKPTKDVIINRVIIERVPRSRSCLDTFKSSPRFH
jgi:cyclophilin family peptidyl-prolyl cis-trans isomerase